MKRITAAMAALSCAAAMASTILPPNLVQNGTFESNLNGWTTTGTVVRRTPGTSTSIYISSAIKSYNNTTWASTTRAGSIAQDVVVESVGDYILEFDYTVRNYNVASPITIVSFGGATLKTLYGDGGSAYGQKVAHFQIPINVAEAGTYELKFSQTSGSDCSASFDNITLRQNNCHVVVEAVPFAAGKPSPDYGTHYNITSQTFTAAEAYTNSAKTAIYRCAGWKIYTLGQNDTWVFDSSVTNATGTGNSFEYVQPSPGASCKIVWQWTPYYLVSAVAGDGGTANVDGVSSNYYEMGSTCLFTATPASASAPVCWTGNRTPDGMAPSNQTFSAKVWAPMALKAQFADVLWVDDDADVGGDGTFNAPFQTIDAALAVLATNSCVAVLPGNYQLSAAKTLSYARTVTGVTADFNDTVVAAASGNRHTFKLTVTGTALRNLTLRGTGGETYNGVVWLTAGLIENCRVTGGKITRAGTTYGSGVRNEGGTVRCCTIDGNTAAGNIFNGLGIYQTGGTTEYCIITNNTYSAWHGGDSYLCPAGVYITGGTLRGCLIARNSPGGCSESSSVLTCGFAIGIKSSSSPVIEGCAIVDNYIKDEIGTKPAAAVYVTKGYNPTFRNNIIQNNRDKVGTADFIFAGAVPAMVEHCLVPEDIGIPAMGNRVEQGGTYVWTNGLFKLKPFSLAVGNAVCKGSANYDLDLYGTRRVVDGTMDIGPVEYEPDASAAASVAIRAESLTLIAPVTNVFSATCLGFPEGAPSYVWTRDSETVSTSADWTAEWLDFGCHTVGLTVTSGDGTVTASNAVTFVAASKDIFLDASCATPVYPYASHETAATNWTDILPLVFEGGSLTVYPGSYVVSNEFALTFPYEVRGVGGRDNIIIRKVGSGRLFLLDNSGAAVRGVTLRGGRDASNGATLCLTGRAIAEDVNLFDGVARRNDTGGGCLYISNATISDSTIGNVSSFQTQSYGDIVYGLGVRMENGALVERCVITNVVSQRINSLFKQGIAVHMTGGTLRNCLVAKNRATQHEATGTQFAIGIYQTGGRVENCTVADNVYRHAKSVIDSPCGYYTSGGTMTNSIVFANVNTDTTTGSNKVWNVAGTYAAAMSHCCTNDPAFWRGTPRSRPYYGVRHSSPCVNAGALLSWMDAEATDLAGARRVISRVPDIGCYETPAPAGSVLMLQ